MRLGRLVVVLLALSSCSSSPERRNVILVSVDTLRADYLSCYGSDKASTPGFDRIAREGLLFENAASVAPTTLPAHASLLTGTSPFEHWVHDNVGFRLRQDLPTLASTLKARGYRTGGFIGSFVLDRKFGLAQGFDVYSDETPETDRGLRERRGEKVLQDALAWIGREHEAPFFAFLHFFDPHRPYDPPPPFAPKVGNIEGLDALYRGEVSYVDSLLQRLLDFLDTRGLSESTVLVVTADHGESLGEHGEDTHGFFLYQSTLHVPLLIRAPGIRHGVRASSLVRTIDIAPTVLELLRVEAPSSFEGVSFVSAKGEVQTRDVDAYAETFVPRLHYGWSELRSLRRGSWKLILAPRSELYDLDSDPGEERNRIDEEENRARGLLAKLEELPGPANVRPESLDPGTLASLHALGYLGGSAPMPAPERSFTELSDPKDKLAVYMELNELSATTDPNPADVERLAHLLEQEPRSTKALSMHGNLLLDLRRPRDARKAFERLLEDPAGELRRTLRARPGAREPRGERCRPGELREGSDSRPEERRPLLQALGAREISGKPRGLRTMAPRGNPPRAQPAPLSGPRRAPGLIGARRRAFRDCPEVERSGGRVRPVLRSRAASRILGKPRWGSRGARARAHARPR